MSRVGEGQDELGVGKKYEKNILDEVPKEYIF